MGVGLVIPISLRRVTKLGGTLSSLNPLVVGLGLGLGLLVLVLVLVLVVLRRAFVVRVSSVAATCCFRVGRRSGFDLAYVCRWLFILAAIDDNSASLSCFICLSRVDEGVGAETEIPVFEFVLVGRLLTRKIVKLA